MELKIPRPLVSDIVSRRCLPFIGAGFSVNGRTSDGRQMPLWGGLASELRKGLPREIDGDPLAIAEEYARQYGRVELIEAVRQLLLDGDVRPGPVHAEFAQIAFDTIYTTNFDVLLELAYQEIRRPHRTVVGELQMPFHGGYNETTIVKMHGDLRHEEHLIVSKGDYDAYLADYPVVATHLSAMLITRTPLFLGYSLSDPDFNHVRNVVKSRLGKHLRMAYVVQFDCQPEKAEEQLAEKFHIINLVTGGGSKEEALLRFLRELRAEVEARSTADTRAKRPDVFEELPPAVLSSAVRRDATSETLSTTSRLCYVIMPRSAEKEVIYQACIRPAVEETGLAPLRADETPSGTLVYEHVEAMIRQARVCIADLSGANPNVGYEFGFAIANRIPVLAIADSLDSIPVDFRHYQVLVYGPNEVGTGELQRRVVDALRAFLTEERIRRSEASVSAGDYGAALMHAWAAVEQILMEMAKSPMGTHPGSLRGRALIDAAQKNWGLPEELCHQLDTLRMRRNQVAHAAGPDPSQAQAAQSVDAARELLIILQRGVPPPKRRGKPTTKVSAA